MSRSLPAIAALVCILSAAAAAANFSGTAAFRRRSRNHSESLCSQLIRPLGYPCTEHTVETEDGFVLGVQRVSSSRDGDLRVRKGPPVLLQHGLFTAGDCWFLNSPEESLGFILADHGFDVWVGNVRGTRWSHGHTTLSEKTKNFWDWSWQELALYDLAEMILYINTITRMEIFVVGHSQGTIMSFAAFTRPDIVKMVKAAALLSPISYLEHVSAPLVLRMVGMHLDQMIYKMGIHQLNFRSDMEISLIEAICDGGVNCNNLLSSITGKNCCFNNSRVDFYLEFEPHPSSSKNLCHLFQMIRKGTFSKYDYGMFKNLKLYGQLKPPTFDLSKIPSSLPLWMGYGGNDALADVTDLRHTLKELKSKPEILYVDNYGHLDFITSTTGKEDVYDHLIAFFSSFGKWSSY